MNPTNEFRWVVSNPRESVCAVKHIPYLSDQGDEAGTYTQAYKLVQKYVSTYEGDPDEWRDVEIKP